MMRAIKPLAVTAVSAAAGAMLAYMGVTLLAADGGGGDAWMAPERAARKKNPLPADDVSVAAGKAVYERECLSCHGSTGRGDGPAARALVKDPGNLSSPKLWEQTDGALFWKITVGKAPMPTEENRITEEQRWQVVNYVRTLAPRPSPAAGAPAP